MFYRNYNLWVEFKTKEQEEKVKQRRLLRRPAAREIRPVFQTAVLQDWVAFKFHVKSVETEAQRSCMIYLSSSNLQGQN